MSMQGCGFRVVTRCVLAVVALLGASASIADDFGILYHESLGEWSVGEDATKKSSSTQSQKPDADSLLTFTAFSRQFRVRLERNDALLRRLPPDTLVLIRGVDVFRGELIDIPGSWVRLTRHDGQLSGVIWDGADLFAIDSPKRVAPYLKSTMPAAGQEPVIFRWRDTTGALTDEVGIPLGGASDGAPAALAVSTMDAMLLPGRQLDLGLVADSHYTLREGAAAVAGMLSRANIVDGIFITQLGLHVNVAELAVLDQTTDPFTSADPVGLLDQLEGYRVGTPAQRTQDLTHLLTGRDLVEPVSGSAQTVGVANVAAVCDERLGTALTQASFGVTIDAMIMAHELGHNFGAPHDGEAGPCAHESGFYIMARTIGNPREFSACSIQQMQPELTSACLGSIVPGDVEIRTLNAPPDAQIGLDFGVDVVVDNLSSASAYGLEVTATGSNLTVLSLSAAAGAGFTCTVSASGPICRRSVLPAGSSATLRLVTRTTAIAPATLQVSVLTLNDVNTANNVVINTFAARPTLDLLVEFAPASDLLHVGDQVEYNATIRNMGNTTATNAEALIWVSPPALHVVDMSSTVGQCTRDPSERYHCPLDSLAPNAARSVSLRLRAVDAVPPHASLGYVHSTISIDAVADQPVHDRVRSYEEKHVTVAEAVADLSTTVSSALQMQLNTPSDLVFTVANRGPDNAKDVLFRFNLPRMHHELVDAIVVPNVGTCTIANRDPLEFNCNVQSLAAGQSLVVTLRATPLRSAEFQLWSSTEGRYFDPVPSNDKVDSFYSVIAAPPPPPPPPTVNVNADSSGGGGGGGALDPLWLVLLGIALATRLRGRRPQNSRAISGVGQY